MNKADIVLIKFPFTDLSGSKRQPALILTTVKQYEPDIIVAFISSVIPSSLSATDVFLSTSDALKFGLKKTSVIKLDKLATLDKSLVTGEFGSLSVTEMELVKHKLKIALEL